MRSKAKALKIGASERVFKTLFATGEVTPKWRYQESFDSSKREQQTRNGVPVWRVGLVSLGYGDLEVSVASPQEPQVEPEMPVRCTGFVLGASPNGGLWFSADSIESAAS